jgi:hypothetical protein
MRVPTMLSQTMLSQKKWLAALGMLLIAVLAAGCGQSPRVEAPAEVTHSSYIDLLGNISDLRARVGQWQKGDEASLGIAEEKLERIEAVLDANSWPESMRASVARTKAAAGPMWKALEAHDMAAAEAAAKEFGDASHDVIHEFYDDFLHELDGSRLGQMAAHIIYLDLVANISDLRTRIGQWEGGDEASMNIAKEKAERIEIILPHLASTGVLAKWIPSIESGLPGVFAAIEREDVVAAQQAAKPIVEASGGLTRDAYVWMDLVGGTTDPACIQASYLDLSRTISALRGNISAWQKGETGSLDLALGNLSRAQILLAHPTWPVEMEHAIARTSAAVALVAQALGQEDFQPSPLAGHADMPGMPAMDAGQHSLVAAEAAVKELGEGSHDLTHDFYGEWLPSGKLVSAGVVVVSGGAKPKAKGHVDEVPHGTKKSAQGEVAEEGPNWTVIGGFLGLLGLVIGGAAVTRPKTATKGKGGPRMPAAPQPAES